MNSLFFKGKVRYPDYELNFDLSLPGSGITALFGASGAGKSTLLRAVAGLVKPENGMIRIKDKTWQDDSCSCSFRLTNVLSASFFRMPVCFPI